MPTQGNNSLSRRLKAPTALAALVVMATVVALSSYAQGDLGRSPSRARSTTIGSIPGRPTTPPRSVGSTRPQVRVVAIGDSVTSGANCSCTAFVGLYAEDLALARGVTTSSVNLGVSGSTSSQLLRSLSKPGAFRDSVSAADVLLITIGANDLGPLESKQPGCSATCYSPLIESIGQNIELIIAAARAAQPLHPPTILATDYWNVFQDGDVGTAENGVAFQAWSDRLTRAESARVCQGVRQAGAICVDLYGPFKGDGSKNPTSLLAADGDHPNSEGHRLIASTLLASTPASFRKGRSTQRRQLNEAQSGPPE